LFITPSLCEKWFLMFLLINKFSSNIIKGCDYVEILILTNY